MKTVNYIFVNETVSQTAVRAIRSSRVSDIRYHIIVNRIGLSHSELIDRLCRLRRQYPNAKILGVSEIDPTSAHAPVRVNPMMNALRREMSDLP